jgi:acyl carrier protein
MINNMEIENFISNFAGQFDETELSAFRPETNFKELEEWSSLIALSVIAMVDEEYDVRIGGDDIRSSSTIQNLYNIVVYRK